MNEAVKVLTSEELTEISGGKLSPKAVKVAKYAGAAAAGALFTIGALVAGAAIAGAAKHGSGAHYFKEWFGNKPSKETEVVPGPTGRAWADLGGTDGTAAYDMPNWKGDELQILFKED